MSEFFRGGSMAMVSYTTVKTSTQLKALKSRQSKINELPNGVQTNGKFWRNNNLSVK